MSKIVSGPIKLNINDDTITFNGKPIEIYEPHGYFYFDAGYWIIYGHEEIVILDHNGVELKREQTR